MPSVDIIFENLCTSAKTLKERLVLRMEDVCEISCDRSVVGSDRGLILKAWVQNLLPVPIKFDSIVLRLANEGQEIHSNFECRAGIITLGSMELFLESKVPTSDIIAILTNVDYEFRSV